MKRLSYSDQEQGNVNKSMIGPRLFNEDGGFCVVKDVVEMKIL